MRMSRKAVLRLSVLISLAAVSLVRASTSDKLSLERLSGEADVIVLGRVEEITTRPASERSPITTVIKISVQRQFKGPKVSAVTIEQAGGPQGDIVLAVPGSAEFSSGEDAILFLVQQRGGAFKIVGGRQGKFTVKTLPESNNEVVEDFARRTEGLNSFLDRLVKMTSSQR